MTDELTPLALSYIYDDWEIAYDYMMDNDAFDPEYELCIQPC